MVALVMGTFAPLEGRADDAPLRWPLTEAEIPPPATGWFAVKYLGVRAGWMRESIERVPAGAPQAAEVIRLTQEGHYGMSYAGERKTAETTLVLDFEAHAPFGLVAGHVESGDANSRRKVALVRTAAGISATSRDLDGMDWTTLLTLDLTLADALTLRLWVQGERKVDDVLRYRWFDPSHLNVATVRAKVVDLGSRGRARWSDLVVEGSGAEQTIRYDLANGRLFLLKQGAYEMIRTTETAAKEDAGSADLLDVLTVAKVDSPLGRTEEIERLVLEASGGATERIASGPRQAVTHGAEGKVRIVLGDDATAPAIATPEEIAEGLRSIERYEGGSGEVARVVAEAVGDAKEPREKVSRLMQWVHSQIRYEISPGDETLGQILRTRRGDCSESGLLFGALARAAGIPVREVIGLAYMGDRTRAFTSHRWNEVVLDGKWIPVDATAGQFPADLARIALSRGTPPEPGVYDKIMTLKMLERVPAK